MISLKSNRDFRCSIFCRFYGILFITLITNNSKNRRTIEKWSKIAKMQFMWYNDYVVNLSNPTNVILTTGVINGNVKP